MSEKETQAVEQQAPAAEPMKNPYIVNFCKVLVEKKNENVQGDELKQLLNDMYRLFENMLGQNMIDALPEELRKEYLELCNDLSKLSYERIAEIFDKNIPHYEEIMKKTMRQFAEIFMKNKVFNIADYPVALETTSS